MNIVVGLDGSATAESVLRTAVEESRLRKANLHVIHVVHVPTTIADGMTFMPGNLIESNYQFAEEIRKSVWERVKASLEGSEVKWVQVDRTGYPADEIVGYAKSIDASLLVVGSRGFGDFKSLLLGSTSHRVSHLAPCDVLIVKTNA